MGAGASAPTQTGDAGLDAVVAMHKGGFDPTSVNKLSEAEQKAALECAMQVVAALWQPRVLAGEKYKAAWNLLRPGERAALESALFEFKIAVRKLQDAFADFLFDETNWTDDGDVGKCVDEALSEAPYKDKREPVLQLFRRIRDTQAVVVMEIVNKHATRVYSDIPGSPGPIAEVVGEGVFQDVPEMFEGEVGATEFPFADAPNEVQKVFRDAAALIQGGLEPCGPGFDGTVARVRDAEEDNKVTYASYLAARGYLLQDRFHAAVAQAVKGVDGVEFLPGKHKGYERYVAKAEEYDKEGVPDPAYRAVKDTVRGSVVCRDHAALDAAHAALLAVFEGKVTKDRREVPSCRDVLQVVLFEGLLCEVQFHFADTLPLKKFSHAAYNVRRPQDYDLDGFDTIFEFSITNMQKETRDSITCKLHF